jgi:hypothetical protein
MPVLQSTPETTRAPFHELREFGDLKVHEPGEPGYDTGRAAWNIAVEHRPSAVVTPSTTRGVVETVRFARRHGLSVAIQSTGHGPTRTVDGALLIDMSEMRTVTVYPEKQMVRIEGGAKWQGVLDVVVPHGLAPLLGSTPDVSAVGYTLGGGLGWLARKYGTSADSAVSFELVAASGQVIRASAEENQDVFWALRGAGAGHLGVVTEMVARLYPICELYAGNLFYPAEMATEIMQRWRTWIQNVPEDLTSAVTLLNLPPGDDVPDELRGASVVAVRGAFDGPAEEGERLLSYWRNWMSPSVDAFGVLPFSRVEEISQDPLEPVPNEGTGLWLHSLGDSTIEALTGAMFPPDGDTLLVQTEIRHAGGALARGSSQASAFGNRDAAMLLEIVGVTPTPEDVSSVRRQITRISAAISTDLTGGVYLNYVEGEDRRHGVVDGIGRSAFERLARVKASLDPDDVFDHGLDVVG